MNPDAGTPASPPNSRSIPDSPLSVRSLLRYWLPVALWLAVIFSMSTGLGSTRQTSRIIGPILRWFNPAIEDETIRQIQLTIRKTAHVGEYAILAALILRALSRTPAGLRAPWNWRRARMAMALTVAVAISDEWHQSFVPGREGAARDVLFDSAGAALGLAAFRWRVRQHASG